jgi:hypothetical protein
MALVDVDALPQWPSAPTDARSPRVVTRRLPGTEGEYEVDNGADDCMLVLSEVQYPWWRTSIDDQRAVPLRVNYTMMGLVVPRGRHIVRLWLEPWSVRIGGAISAAAFTLWMMLVFRRSTPTGKQLISWDATSRTF